RYVVEAMRAGGYVLGGEQSGHIILGDYVTTGDGLLAALQVLEALIATDRRASELCQIFDPFPQVLKNVPFGGTTAPLEAVSVRNAIAEGEARLAGTGRLVIRASGTEPLIRVMGEAEDPTLLTDVVDGICAVVEEVAG
ncbi:MAG: phosphoglucosamine mutase, partial [Pseudomonadota bacterium]